MLSRMPSQLAFERGLVNVASNDSRASDLRTLATVQ